MDPIIRKIPLRGRKTEEIQHLLRQEWLVGNGLGGYASGTLSGSVSRRYHALLVSALPAPFGRMVMLNHLSELIRLPEGGLVQIGGGDPDDEQQGQRNSNYLTEFRLENQLPVWRYEIEGIIIERRVVLLYSQNTVHITYQLLSQQEHVRLELRPSMHFRPHESPVNEGSGGPYLLSINGPRFEVSAQPDLPPLRLLLEGDSTSFTLDRGLTREVLYQQEADRGYASRGSLWSPGYFSVNLIAGHDAALIASTESWNTMLALRADEALGYEFERSKRMINISDPKAHAPPACELVLAADQFIIKPAGRIADTARAHAAGDEIRTIIAGYHWFTDWGRDTMISLEGLTLTTRRYTEAGWILRTFAHYIRDGLIPNMFPEGQNKGLYHTADATLWFFHALARYLDYTNDRSTLRSILPKLKDVVQYHLGGTRFGIGVDPKDGLLRQGEEGYQLTWMDAKVDDWVVTPRRGKPVEINALWYNALRLLQRWVQEEEGDEAARPLGEHAQKARESFNKRFWYSQGGYLYDLIDGEHGDDHSCRPNQILAISLPNSILDQNRWNEVLAVVEKRLLTPVGLRSLAPGEPDYKPKYFGDLRARDAAYHQGTVWAWLIGPFIDAWLKVHPEDKEARRFVEGFISHLGEGCIGSISEIFDAEPPFTPRGCIAQAWSVAEVLRCWVKTG